MNEDADKLRAALDSVNSRIRVACAKVGRDPAGVQVLPVTKGVTVERLRIAVDLGLTDFGENRVQEAEEKAASLAGATWHMIGRLQSNKAARAVELFGEIQSVDSVALAERLGRLASERDSAPYPVYLQVNVDADVAKAGFSTDQLEDLAPQLALIDGLEIRGLMTVGRLTSLSDEARGTFRALRDLSVRVRATNPRIGGGLSMGMSDDFEVAVEEGATVVRLGRVLFGERPAA